MFEKKPVSEKVFEICLYAFFTIFAFICAYPFYYLIINTLSANNLSANGEINFFIKGFHLQNYIDVIQLQGIGHAAFISIARTVIGTCCTVFASAFLGFMFTQKRLPFRKILYRFVVITMYFSAGLIPMFIAIKSMNLLNSFWVYIIPAIVQPFNVILVKTYMESISASLQEAAEIDGAGLLTIFWKIILPASTPILATIAIFAAVGQWNSFQDTLLYITDQDLYTLQYILQQYINQASSLAALVKNSTAGTLDMASIATQQTPTSIRMTVSVIVTLPILFIYPIFQKHFVKGIMLGAVKE